MLRPIFLFAGLFLTYFNLEATADEAKLLSAEFTEILRSTANTSGARIAGLQIMKGDVPQELSAQIPASWAAEEFCVRTISSDGLYESENVYLAPDSLDLPVQIPHIGLSDVPQRIRSLKRQSFGILINKGRCNIVNETTDNALALWGTKNNASEFSLLVNSFDADRLVAFTMIAGAPRTAFECTKIEAELAVAFDRVCILPIDPLGGILNVELVSLKKKLRGRSEFLRIEMP